MNPSTPAPQRIHFIANCMYGTHLAGGDVHFFRMAEAAHLAGYDVRFIGGHALQHHLRQQNLPYPISLTDRRMLKGINPLTIRGQFHLFADYFARFVRSLRFVRKIDREDLVYAVSDFWFDSIPAILSSAKRRLMLFEMESPTFREVLTAGRPDVVGNRMASLHYCLSQGLALRWFAACKCKKLLYVHPDMKAGLMKAGYSDDELVYVPNGVDSTPARNTPESSKQYDLVWIGRLHRQKGIDDLIKVLVFLSKHLEGFRAVLAGPPPADLQVLLGEAGIADHVDLVGFVSDEKFRLLKASRLFLMPSHYESWGIVIGEAVCSGTPVLAYDLEPYRAVFRSVIHTVKSFDTDALSRSALDLIRRSRQGNVPLDRVASEAFAQNNSWETVSGSFVEMLRRLQPPV